MIQSLLASSRPSVLGRHPMEEAATEVILEGVYQFPLQGFHSPQPAGDRGAWLFSCTAGRAAPTRPTSARQGAISGTGDWMFSA